MHINTCNLPSGEFSFWGSLAGSTARKFSRTRSLRAHKLCVDKRALLQPSRCLLVKNCRRDTVISTRGILSRRGIIPISWVRRAIPLVFIFFSLSLATVCVCARARGNEEKERAKDELTKIQKCQEVCVGIYPQRYTRIFPTSSRLFPSPFSLPQITDFHRRRVLCTYVQPSQRRRTVLRGNIASVFTYYNFAMVYNLQAKRAYA